MPTGKSLSCLKHLLIPSPVYFQLHTIQTQVSLGTILEDSSGHISGTSIIEWEPRYNKPKRMLN